MLGQVDLGQRVRLTVVLDHLLAGTAGSWTLSGSRPRVPRIGGGGVHRWRNDDPANKGYATSEGRRSTEVILRRPDQIDGIRDRHRSVREVLVLERFEDGSWPLPEDHLLIAAGRAGRGTAAVVSMVRIEGGP